MLCKFTVTVDSFCLTSIYLDLFAMQFNGLNDLKLKDNVSSRVRYFLGLPAIATHILVLVLQWRVFFRSVFGLKSC